MAAERRFDGRHHGPHRLGAGHVAAETARRGIDLRGDPFGLGGVASQHRHPRARRREALGDRAPDAAGAAGDDGRPAGEVDGDAHAVRNFSRSAAVPSGVHCASGTIRLSRPVNTLPGPNSSQRAPGKRSARPSIDAHPPHRRGELIGQRPHRVVARCDERRRGIGNDREDRLGERHDVERLAQRVGGRLHQRRVEGAADLERQHASRAMRHAPFAGAVDRRRITGDHRLIGGVEIGGHDRPDSGLARRAAGRVHLCFRQAEHRRHRARTRHPRFVHQRAPAAHQSGRVGGRDGAGGDPGAVFAQRVTRGGADVAEVIADHRVDRDRMGEDGGLGVVGQGELVVRALPHQRRQRLLQRVVDLLQHVARGRKAVGEIARHADPLRPLTGKEEHRHHRTTTLPQVKPAPNATSIATIPGLSRPSSSACTSASGMLAELVLP